MSFVEVKGDLFRCTAEAIGHGCNAKGVMHAGIANTFRIRFPDMYGEYWALCFIGELVPGDIFFWESPDKRNKVYSLITQPEPGQCAKLEYIEKSVELALAHAQSRGIKSLALPRIGCGIGGLDWENVRPILFNLARAFPKVDLMVFSFME